MKKVVFSKINRDAGCHWCARLHTACGVFDGVGKTRREAVRNAAHHARTKRIANLYSKQAATYAEHHIKAVYGK